MIANLLLLATAAVERQLAGMEHDVRISELTGEEVANLARAAIAARPGWQAIETAPKDGTHVWLYYPGAHPDDRQCVGWFSYAIQDGVRWIDHADAKDDLVPTHWMPLPPAPEAQP